MTACGASGLRGTAIRTSPSARPGRVLHAHDIEDRQRHHVRGYDLPDPPLLRFGQRNPGGRGGTGLIVFCDTADDQAASSVGQRGHIGGGITLVLVRRRTSRT